MNLFRLDGKLAVVTGGTGLYGKPICSALASAGARVIIASRDEARCREFASVLNLENFQAEGLFLDLADQNSIEEFVRRVSDRYGNIDVLVNNAVSRDGKKPSRLIRPDSSS
jgi:NAD(P)-dependent dehydrogenase (short-subunit alcohol dehydrogenase family)